MTARVHSSRGRSLRRTLAGLILALVAPLVLSMYAPADARAGAFHVRCAFSHRLADDPIVHPRHPGMSHWHDFFGSRTTHGSSTYASMLRSGTTCGDPLDTAGYWHPRVRIDGRARRGTLVAYYSRGGKPTVKPFPPDLRVVAGDARATAPQPRRIVFWRCVTPGEPRSHLARGRSTVVPRCGRRQRVSANIRFPDCWDGRRLDSPDHTSHMAYSRRGRCPATHPVPLPELVMSVAWNARPRGGSAVRLASGGAWTMHADFWNTWQQRRLKALVYECLDLDIDCGDVGSGRQ